MKFLVMTAIVLFTTTTFARTSSYFDYVSEEFCPELNIDYKKDVAYCKAANADDVKKAKVGPTLTVAEYEALGFSVYYAIDAGLVVDGDSDTAYFFKRWLINAAGDRVGVITFEGWYNTEMEASRRFDTRYNLKGETVMVTSREM